MRSVRAGMTVLLSPTAGMWFSKFSIPSPGHILIYGPPVSSRPRFCCSIWNLSKINLVHFWSLDLLVSSCQLILYIH